MALNPRFKLFLDLFPIVVFFIGYKLFGLFAATALLIGLTLVSLVIIYAKERRVAIGPLITAIVVTIFGGLTLYLHDERFIKIKPTLINLIFAAILLGGCLYKKGLIRHILGAAYSMTDKGWFLLSRRFGLFFLCMAGVNEWVWRNFSTDVWVDFKAFGLIGSTMVFMVLQVKLLEKYHVNEVSQS